MDPSELSFLDTDVLYQLFRNIVSELYSRGVEVDLDYPLEEDTLLQDEEDFLNEDTLLQDEN